MGTPEIFSYIVCRNWDVKLKSSYHDNSFLASGMNGFSTVEVEVQRPTPFQDSVSSILKLGTGQVTFQT